MELPVGGHEYVPQLSPIYSPVPTHHHPAPQHTPPVGVTLYLHSVNTLH